ncbi:MAG: chemotaxis protein CheA [Armatimonadetes bacterium]|nr:chemotaxis protein CheA [Armatimonadota bacterium]
MDLSKYLEAFATEASEHLQQMEQLLLQLERTPVAERTDLLNEMFRSAHTVKGAAGSMEFTDIATLAHRLESALERLRSGTAAVTPEAIDAALAAVDALGTMVSAAVQGTAADVDVEALCAHIEREICAQGAEEEPAGAPDSKGETSEAARAPGIDMAAAMQAERAETLRVKVEQLDALVDLVGELVTVRSRLVDIGERYRSEALGEGLDHLTQITTQLQSEALRMRMVPVAHVFDRFPRIMRALAKDLGKQVEFDVHGRDIELDRIILDRLHEPLIHLLRNALDHGFESPEARGRIGKPATGRLTLEARREREHVVIEVADDGRGMDVEAIKAKAIQRGMVTAEESALLTEAQALMMACEPGFSTAEQVTQVSGRGVGMDVVKTTAEAVGGNMEIESQPGVGTRFVLHLPVTLAIVRVLLIRLGNEVYAIPLSNVMEAVDFADVNLRTVSNREVVVIRDSVLALVRVKQLLDVPDAPTNGSARVLVVEVGRQRIGVLIDGVVRQQEVVIKPLNGILRRSHGFAGATILGDGRAVLVLDPASLLLYT